jgi:hypothetical protein
MQAMHLQQEAPPPSWWSTTLAKSQRLGIVVNDTELKRSKMLAAPVAMGILSCGCYIV